MFVKKGVPPSDEEYIGTDKMKALDLEKIDMSSYNGKPLEEAISDLSKRINALIEENDKKTIEKPYAVITICEGLGIPAKQIICQTPEEFVARYYKKISLGNSVQHMFDNIPLHSVDGAPAIEFHDGSKSWFWKGVSSRLDGPAVVRNGEEKFVINGFEVAADEYEAGVEYFTNIATNGHADKKFIWPVPGEIDRAAKAGIGLFMEGENFVWRRLSDFTIHNPFGAAIEKPDAVFEWWENGVKIREEAGTMIPIAFNVEENIGDIAEAVRQAVNKSLKGLVGKPFPVNMAVENTDTQKNGIGLEFVSVKPTIRVEKVETNINQVKENLEQRKKMRKIINKAKIAYNEQVLSEQIEAHVIPDIRPSSEKDTSWGLAGAFLAAAGILGAVSAKKQSKETSAETVKDFQQLEAK